MGNGSAKSRNNMKNRGIDEKILFIFSKTLMLNQNMLILEALWVCVTCIYVIHFNLNHNFHFRSENILMAHERIEVRSEEHTSELQSRGHLVCRLLLEKK